MLDPTRRSDHEPPDLATLVALAREGLTLQAIGERVGRSRGRVWQILTAHHLRIAELRNVQCAACGGLLGKAELTTRSGRHYCAAAACKPAYELDMRDHEWQEVQNLLRALNGAAGLMRPQRADGRIEGYVVPVGAWQRVWAAAVRLRRGRPRPRVTGEVRSAA